MTDKPPYYQAFCERIEKARQSKKTWTREARIKKVTPEKLVECLRWSGWDVHHCGCGHYRLIDSRGQPTIMEMLSDRIELDFEGFGGGMSFFFKGCEIRIMPDENREKPNPWDTTSLVARGSKEVFVHFHKVTSA